MITIDVSNLPKLEERRRALAEQQKMERIIEERDAVLEPLLEKRDAARRRLYAEMEAALRPFDDEIAAAEKPFHDQLASIEEDKDLFRRDWDFDCSLKLCALSGLPILQDEEVIEDAEVTGGLIIRALLPFPADATEATEDPTDRVPA